MISPAQHIPLSSEGGANDSLAVAPLASPSAKKGNKSEPTADIARAILVERFSHPSEMPLLPSPLERDRVTSLLNESDLGDYFVPFSEDGDYISESGEDLEDEESIEEDPEDQNLKTEFDAYLEREETEIRYLLFSYKEWEKRFKAYASGPNVLLAALEYLTDNKDNIVNFIKQYGPKEADTAAETSLEIVDHVFKWIDCGVPFLENLIKSIFIQINYDQPAQKIKDSASQFMRDHQHQTDVSTASIDRVLKNHARVSQFQAELAKDNDDAKSKSCLKGVRLLTKLSAIGLGGAGLGFLASKTANTVTKSAYKIFKTSLAAWNCYYMFRDQKEWMFHLQPDWLVNIGPKDPTAEEEERLEIELEAQEDLIHDAKEFLISLNKCTSLDEVEKIFKSLNVPFPLPPTIDHFKQMLRKNPRFGRDLVQCYYYHVGRRATISASKLLSAIDKKEEEHHRKIDQCLPFITGEINKCQIQNLSFDGIQDHFAKLHIDIDSITISVAGDLPLPPTNALEWGECTQNDEFIRALAGKWVEHQEATAQMVMQALRQALLSKHQVERQFLIFQAVEIGVGFLSTVIQLYLCSPIQSHAISFFLEVLIKDIAKWGPSGVGVFYLGTPLYPGVKFKIDVLFMQLAKHFFAKSYKPNEYSLEGYLLILKQNWTKLLMLVFYLQFMLQQGQLWINVRLVDNCIKGLENKSLAEDLHYIDLAYQYNQKIISCKQAVKDFEKDLQELKVKDTQLTIQPQSQNTSDNDEPSGPIHDIIDALKEADIEYFPPLVIEFFENHLGFEKLSNDNKEELLNHLNNFFSKSEEKFLSSYLSNRFAYLKA